MENFGRNLRSNNQEEQEENLRNDEQEEQQETEGQEMQGENISNAMLAKEWKNISIFTREPMTLPAGLSWFTFDMNNPNHLQEICDFSNSRNTSHFRFKCLIEMMKWFLTPPGYEEDWHIGIYHEQARSETNNTINGNEEVKENSENDTPNRVLVAWASAIPRKLVVYEKYLKIAEVIFLVGRNKVLLEVLKAELRRRADLVGTHEMIFVAENERYDLGFQFAQTQYWLRVLNAPKLIDLDVLDTHEFTDLNEALQLYALPSTFTSANFQRMNKKKLVGARFLVKDYLRTMAIYPIYTTKEFEHWFSYKENIVDSYVVLDRDGKVTDFISYYYAPSYANIDGEEKLVMQSFSLYLIGTQTPKNLLMTNAFIAASKSGIDIMAVRETDVEDFSYGYLSSNCSQSYYVLSTRFPLVQPEKMALNII